MAGNNSTDEFADPGIETAPETPKSYQIIDSFHALIDGVKTRVFPSTGRKVILDKLGDSVRWMGGNLAIGEDELITLADSDGAWSCVPWKELRTHPVWYRLDSYSTKRINDGLNASNMLNRRIE
jgi:hypothetical protein